MSVVKFVIKSYVKYDIIVVIKYEDSDMEGLTFINGATVSATSVRKNWKKIVEGVKASHKPVFVLTNNTPEAVVLSFEEFQNLERMAESARREALGQKMVSSLMEIAELTNNPIKHMVVNQNGVFEEAEGQ